MKRLRWEDERPAEPPPKHPYRDTALVYLGFAVVIVGLAWITGGDLTKAVVVAGLFWLAGTSFGVVSWRRKLRRRELP